MGVDEIVGETGQINKQSIIFYLERTNKISLEMVRHENDVHNSSKNIFIS